MSLNENTNNHIVLEGSGNMSTTFTEDTVNGLTITDIPGNGADTANGIFISNTDATNTVSGFTITGGANGIELSGSASNIVQNNIIRQTTSDAILHTSVGNPIIRNNVIVNNQGAGIFVQSSGSNGNIIGNLIRQNTRSSGAGIYIDDSPVTIENNLIIENHSTSNNSTFNGGSGIYVASGTTNATIINNTIAHNISNDTANGDGAGLHIESTGGTITLRDNIIFGNTDSSVTPDNDIFDDAGAGTFINSNNLIGSIFATGNQYVADGTDLVGSDPLFVQGWYLDSTGAPTTDSPAIDAGSADATNILPVPLNTLTTRIDGGLDDGSVLPSGDDTIIVNLGYHYASGEIVADGTATDVISVPASPVTVVSGTGDEVVITITPRDSLSNVIGAGLDVQAIIASNPTAPSTGIQTTTGTNSTMGTVKDLGNGDYTVTSTPDDGTARTGEVISFTINGVSISTTITVTWTIS